MLSLKRGSFVRRTEQSEPLEDDARRNLSNKYALNDIFQICEIKSNSHQVTLILNKKHCSGTFIVALIQCLLRCGGGSYCMRAITHSIHATDEWVSAFEASSL